MKSPTDFTPSSGERVSTFSVVRRVTVSRYVEDDFVIGSVWSLSMV